MHPLLRSCSLVGAIAILTSGNEFARAGGYGKDSAVQADDAKCHAPTKVHIHYVPVPKLCHALCGPPPPDVPVVESAAIRRVAVPMRTNFRVQQEAGELRPQPEAGEAKCGSEQTAELLKVLAQNGRLDEMDQKLQQLDGRLDQLIKLVELQQAAIKQLADKKKSP